MQLRNLFGIVASLTLILAIAPYASADVGVGVDANGDGDCDDFASTTVGPATVEHGEVPASFGNALVEERLSESGVSPTQCVPI